MEVVFDFEAALLGECLDFLVAILVCLSEDDGFERV